MIMSNPKDFTQLEQILLSPLADLNTFDAKNKYINETVYVVGGKERTVREIISKIPELQGKVNADMLATALLEGNPEDPGYTLSKTISDKDMLETIKLANLNYDSLKERYSDVQIEEMKKESEKRSAEIEEYRERKADLTSSVEARTQDFSERSRFFAGDYVIPWLEEVDPTADSIVDQYDWTLKRASEAEGFFGSMLGKIGNPFGFPITREIGPLGIPADIATGAFVPMTNLFLQGTLGWTDLFRDDDNVGKIEMRDLMFDPETDTWGPPAELKEQQEKLSLVTKALDELENTRTEYDIYHNLNKQKTESLRQLNNSIVGKLVRGGYSTQDEIIDILSK
tara:strand:+ start:1209 stop:2228 length:1020 start_codon:yes stop_codon:yes gene_type:complete